MALLPSLCIFFAISAAGASSRQADVSEGSKSDTGRTFGALLPLSLAAMPLLAPIISKGVFVVLLSGLAYLTLFVGSFFFPVLGGLIGLGPIAMRSFDGGATSAESSLDRVARVVRQAIASTEESVTGGTTQCRRRLVCELSKAVSDGVPRVEMFDNYFRNRSEEADSYAGAWASGWLGRDCSRFYHECDRTSVDSLSTLVGILGGTDGYIGSLLSGFTNSSSAASTERTTASWLISTIADLQTSTPQPSAATTRQDWASIVQRLVTFAATQDFQKLVTTRPNTAAGPHKEPVY